VSAAPPDPRVDELRQQLRSLGYLNAGVDRFVLAPASGGRTATAIALLASLRIGVLGAFLLGPAAAIGLHGRMPGLITGPRDAVVVALYLGLLFGLGIAAVSFAASLLVSLAARGSSELRLARLARPLATAAGVVVTVACLVYLTFWWRTADAGFGWTSAGWTILALAVSAVISLLLGHAVTVTALALIVATHGTTPANPGVRAADATTWKRSIAVAAIAFAGAAVLLFISTPSAARDGTPPPLTVVSSGLRVRLFAIDGFDPGVFNRLQLPALASVLHGRSATLAPEDSRDPARFWTTVATAQPPEVHGVRALETRRVAGVTGALPRSEPSALGRAIEAATDLLRLTRPGVASGSERRTKTFWEVASDAGLRTAVVNWWATWPAPADAGAVITDRATLRLDAGGKLDAEIAPQAVYDDLKTRWTALKVEASALAWQVGEMPELRRSAELDAMQVLIAREVGTPDIDLVATYLPGLDLLQHALLAPTEGSAPQPSAVAARLAALDRYYVYLDRLLAPMLKPSDREVVLVMTGPGRVQTPSSGLIALAGGPARSASNASARMTDVMPTVLYLLGLPMSREIRGLPVLPLVSHSFAERYAVRDVPTYGAPRLKPAPREGRPLDKEMLDRLRSLGYVR
jgi:hypothetical protein